MGLSDAAMDVLSTVISFSMGRLVISLNAPTCMNLIKRGKLISQMEKDIRTMTLKGTLIWLQI